MSAEPSAVWSLAMRVMPEPEASGRSAGLHHVHHAGSSFFPSVSARVSALRKVLGRLNLRHGDLRAWSSLRLGPKLPPSCARRVGRRDRLAARRPCARLSLLLPALLFLILSLSVCLVSPPRVLDLLPTYHFHFTSLHFIHTSQPFTHHSGSLYKLTSHHFTTIDVTSLS